MWGLLWEWCKDYGGSGVGTMVGVDVGTMVGVV